MNQVIIYCKLQSARLAFIVDFIFNERFGFHTIITSNTEEFTYSSSFKINYSTDSLHADLQLFPQHLLFENSIDHQSIHVNNWDELPIFFQTNASDIPFDLLSAVFYLVVRYEEYLPFEPDLYQRFSHESSLAFQHQFLSMPLIDLWLLKLKEIMLTKNNSLVFKKNNFQFLPTYDIDIAYSYRGKGLKRAMGAMFKDLMHGNLSAIKERIQVLQNFKLDPYDSYTFLDTLHTNYKLSPIYFFLVGENGVFDKNILFEKPEMQLLIERIKSKYEIGVHPSYGSNQSLQQLQEEVQKMDSSKSRQHYIRFEMPHTFQQLISLGITEDYSMGYGSINGFRASTSFPFYWFDLSENKVTKLRMFPFCYMECNSFYEQLYSATQALEEMNYYGEQVRAVDGTYISIWHNFSLGTDTLWLGWKQVYESFLDTLYK